MSLLVYTSRAFASLPIVQGQVRKETKMAAIQATRTFAAHIRAAQIKSMPQWKMYREKLRNKASYYPQLGLLYDDCLSETDEVKEAVRRMPEALQNERLFRITRAMDLSAKKILLPQEEWTKVEEDYPYLVPFMAEVRAEEEEKIAWNKQ